MQNVEYKAELRDLPLARSICAALHAPLVETLQQTDTYFRLADGRLKRRECPGHPTEYIFYARDNHTKARISRFRIYSEAEARTMYGQNDLPVWVTVRKHREVYMAPVHEAGHASVRVHLDRVDNLGAFLEFECLVTPRNNLAKAHQAVETLRRAFHPALGEPVSLSYSDLLAADLDDPTPPETASSPPPGPVA